MANRYWVGGTGTWNTTSTTNWSASSGGASGASVPTAADSVFFDQASTYTVTMTGALLCLDITVSAGTVTFSSTGTLAVSGSMSLVAGTIWNATGAITFNATTTGKTITTNGTTISSTAVTFNGVGGSWILGSTLTLSLSATTTLTNGTLDLSGFNLTTGVFSSANSNTRSIAFGSGNIILNTSGAALVNLSMATATNFTWTGTGGFTANATVTRTFNFGNTAGGSSTNAPNLTLTGDGVSIDAVATITTGSYFNTLTFSGTTFAMAATTLNVNSLFLSSTGTFTSLSTNMVGTGTVTPNGKSVATFTVNHSGTTTLAGALGCSAYAQTAGSVDFATYNLTSTTTVTYTAGTLTNIGTITCTTWTCSGTFTMTNGTITPSVSFVVTGGFNYNGGTLSAVPTFTHSSGTVTLGQAYALTAVGTYTLTGSGSGTLNLNGYNLTTGIFSSSGSGARSIAFGTGNIILAHTTVATTVLSMANATGFTLSGTGGFTADASVTRTFTFGTTAGSSTNAPNLTLTGSGTAIATLTNGSWFNKLDFGTTAFNPGTTTLNLNSLTLSSGGTFTTLTATMAGTGTIVTNGNTTLGPLIINNGAGTTTLTSALNCTTYTQTAGTIDFATFNLTCSASATYTAGTLNNIGTITCTTWTCSGTFTMTQGTITPSTSFVVNGAFNYNGGTLSPVPTFTQTSSNVTFNKAYALTATGTYSLGSSCTLTLNGFDLTTGIFSSSSLTARSIAFGSNNIILSHTTAGTTNLAMSGAGNFTCTGTGGFVADASITRTFTVGTTIGPDIAPNLTFTGSGSAVQTLTSGSYFNNLNFGTTAFNPGTTTVNFNSVVLSTSGTYTGVTLSAAGTGSITSNGKPVAALTINGTDSSVTTFVDQLTFATATATTTLTRGTLDLSGFDLTTGAFASTGSQVRSIIFGSKNIILSTTTAASVNLSMANATGFTWTGTGGFIAAANITRTFEFGTTGGSSTNAPNLTLTGSGTAIQTFSTDSWFNNLNFGTTAFAVPTTSLFVSTLTLSSGGTFSALQPILTRTQTWTAQFSKQLNGLGFNCPGGTLTLDNTQTYTLSTTPGFQLTQGTVDLGGYDLTISRFYGSGSSTRSIIFGSNNIILAGTTAGQTNVSMSTLTNFTYTGTGGFVAAANITRTFNIGANSGGTSTNAPNLTFTGSGTAIQTITTGSWIKTLNFGTTAFAIPTTIVNVQNLTLSSGGDYTSLTVTAVGSGTLTFNNKTISGFEINAGTGNSATLASSLTVTAGTTLTSGTLDLGGYDLYTNTLGQSSSANARGIAFGSNNIILQSATIGATNLDLADATNFSCSGTGGFTAAASTTRTFTFGTTGGTATNAPNLSFTGSGTTQQTITSGSWFKTLNYGTTATTANTATLYLDTLILASGGTYTGLRPQFTRTQTWTSQYSKQLGGMGVNGTGVTLTLDNTQTYTATAAFTLTAGTLDLGGYDLTIGTFVSSFTAARSIAFGSNNIILSTTTAGATNLSMSTADGFTWTGTGGFVAAADITRTFNFGANTGGSSTNAPNLTFTGSGTAVQTIISFSYFNKLDFGTTAFDAGTTLINVNNITLSSSGTYASVTIVAVGTGTITTNGKTISRLTVNCPAGTTTLAGDVTTDATNASTLTAGTLDLAGYTLTVGIFSSTNANTRSINFGSGNIVLTYQFTQTATLSMANATGFTWTGTGGFTTTLITGGNSQTYTFGSSSSSGTSTNAPNLTFTGSATGQTPTLTTGSWFNKLDFGTTSFTPPATTINVNSLTLSSGGTFTSVSVNLIGTGTLTPNGKTIAALAVNHSGTSTLAGALGCTTYTQTAGTIDFATFNLTCSSSATYTAGTLNNIGTISCNTWTCAGTFTLSQGTITPSTSFVVTGGFNYNGGTLSAVPTFTHSSGTVTLGKAYALTATGTYTLTASGAGTLNLNGYDLTTGIFSSTGPGARSIAFGSNNIVLNHTTAATTVLAMASVSGFTWTGTGGFTTDASITRTVVFGSSNGSSTNAPNLTLTGSGTAVITITNSSWFNTLNFGTTAFALPSASLFVNNMTLSSGGTFTSLTVTTVGTGTITTNGKTIAAFTVNCPAGTTTLAGALTTGVTNTTTLSAGTLDLAGYILTTGALSSSNSNTRSIAFGTGSIVLTHTTAGTTVVQMPDVTGFTYTGTPTVTTTAAVTRTFSFGSTAGGSASNALNLSITSGAAVPTITSGSWFKTLDFTGTTSTPATTIINVDTLTLATGGTYTGVTPIFTRTQTWTAQFSKQLNGIGVNGSGVTLTLDSTQTYTATSTCYLTQGTLNLGGSNQTFGIFDSNSTSTRAIAFGSNNIILGHTTAGTTVINAPDITNFSYTGTGGFTTAMSVTRTFTFGSTAGGSASNAVSLSLTSGASVPTITNGSWFKSLSFTGTTSTISGIVNVDTLTLATGGTYTGLTPIFTSTQTWTPQFSKQLAGIGVSGTGATLTLDNTQTYAAGSTLYVNGGTLNLNSTNQTFANFNSTGTGSRSITGGGSITITSDWTVTTGSGFTGTSYTIYMTKATGKTFAGGGGTYGILVQKSASTLTITGSNTFADIQISNAM